MHEISIGRPAQGAILLGVLAAVGALIAAQLPELQRYMRIRSM